MGGRTLLAGTPTQSTGYPLQLSDCNFTVMRGPLSGNQAPHRLSLLLIGLTLQGGRTTYPASPQGNTQLCRKKCTVNNAALMYRFTTVTMYNLRKMCSKANTRFATRKEHQTTRALGSEKSKQVFFQVSSDSKNFLQSYTSTTIRSTALSTNELQIDTIPRPKNSIEQSRHDTTIPKHKRKSSPGHSFCVPAVPKFTDDLLRSETTCRAVAARGFLLLV